MYTVLYVKEIASTWYHSSCCSWGLIILICGFLSPNYFQWSFRKLEFASLQLNLFVLTLTHTAKIFGAANWSSHYNVSRNLDHIKNQNFYGVRIAEESKKQ